MCLPTRFLKCIVQFNAWIVTLLGVVSVIAGIVIGVKTSGSTDSFFNSGLGFSKNALVMCFYIFGAALLFFGVFGIVGGKKKNAFCLFIFNIFVIVAFLAFAITGTVALALSAELQDGTCTGQDWSNDINQVALAANQTFCTSSCQCLVTNPSRFPASLNTSNINYTSNPAQSNYTEFSQCPNVSLSTKNETFYQTLSLAEQTFSCTGWCNTYPVYQFTNSSDVPGNTGCYVEVADFVHSYGKGAGIASAIIAFVMLLTILFSCCLCCHPDQKNQAHTNYYKRMAYYDE